VPDAHGGRRGQNSTSEVYIRNMFDAWLGYMTTPTLPSPARGGGLGGGMRAAS
jgi:hypothetical protein